MAESKSFSELEQLNPPPYTAPQNTYPPYPPTSQTYSPPGGGAPYPASTGNPAGYIVTSQGQPSQFSNPTTTTTITYTTQPQPANTTTIIIQTPTCTKCHVGRIEESFTCLGICLGIWLFPIGIICCLAMRRKYCNHCGHIFA